MPARRITFAIVFGLALATCGRAAAQDAVDVFDPPVPMVHEGDDRKKLSSNAPRVGAGESCASAATRRVEGARAAAAADGVGPNLLGLSIEVVETSLEKVAFALGRLAVEDFMEILLVAGNGYGVAGLKLLRSMFERMVTMMYLIRHPDEVENFLGFHWVHLRKTVNHLKATGGDPAKYYSTAELADLATQYQSVRPRYEILCECGRSRGLPAWTKRDMATLTRDVGLEASYLTLYVWPTFQVHTTTSGMVLRLEETSDGVLFRAGAQRQEADNAALAGHTCMAIVLEEQNRFFSLGIDVEKMRTLYRKAWPMQTPEDPATESARV